MSPDRKYIDPPRWTAEQFETDRETSIKEFRDRRITEPLEDYLERFEAAQDVFETLVEQTVDLTQIYPQAFGILTDPKLVDAFRYDRKILVERCIDRAREIGGFYEQLLDLGPRPDAG